MTENPEDGAKEAVKIVSEHWDKLAPTALAFIAIKNLDEEKNADDTLTRLEEVIATVSQDEKIGKLIDYITKKIIELIASEVDIKRKEALKKLQILFLERYAQ